MGAGRRVQTVNVDSANEPKSVNHRGLKKQDLGGVIFVCSNDTQQECVSKRLFGLTRPHLTYVLNIEEGLPLFLYNYDEKLMHGLFSAASDGAFSIDPHAWTDGKTTTRYPSQVRVKLDKACAPVHEKMFSRVIRDNYMSVGRFMFELTKKQAHELAGLFKPVAPPPANAPLPAPPAAAASSRTVTKVAKVVPVPNAWKQVIKDGSKPPVKVAPPPPPAVASVPPPSAPAPLPLPLPMPPALKPSVQRGALTSDISSSVAANMAESVLKEDVEAPKQAKKWHEMVEEEEEPVLDRILENLREKTPAQASHKVIGFEEPPLNNNVLKTLEAVQTSISKLCSDAQSEVREAEGLLTRTMEELRVKGECLKELDAARKKNASLASKSVSMVQEIANLRSELNQLKLEYEGMAQAGVKKRSLFVIGGFNGSKRLNNFDEFIVDDATLKPGTCLLSPRSCGGAAVLQGQLYVFGGLKGENWINTAEKYDPGEDRWLECQPLKIARGMLAGVTINDKIYAIGGRNINTFYSETEAYDPELGWLSSVSMLHKRCSLSAAASRGAMYAFGGTDGVGKLDKVERFDPRESMWSELKPMPCKRVWHCSALYKDKVFMIGGFDGSTYLTSVESYDVRAGKWESVAKIHQPRSHGAAAVVDGSIYLIGGLDRKKNYIGTVEYYREDGGWTEVEVGGQINRSLHCLAVL